MTATLVPGPVIINASTAPWLAPTFINIRSNGKADALETYNGSPIIAARGTA
ncbi:unnamed protein product [marine sediment metagenome]|uniref:Uncharacterized protein n=1 Tax=marine sediment metagenome TaxID=412755 RepID=X0ZWF5_9ZZZZ